MQLNNWKIYDKKGSPLNWYGESYLPLTFTKDSNSRGAAGYLITDPSGSIIDSQITQSGYYYGDGTSVSYTYSFGDGTINDITSDVSILYKDVSIFKPDAVSTKGIDSLTNIDVSAIPYPYPSTVYSSALFLQPVSKGLVETEHLFIFEKIDASLVRPYDTSTSTLVLQFYGEESEIQFFTVDNDTEEITWTNQLTFELDNWADKTPLNVNIGFRSDDEGVYERRLRMYNKVGSKYYLMAEIIVNAESIGEDERFRTLLSNFGLPDPKEFPTLFKDADINEALPDYKIVNPKSKQMILEHDNIIPFIGTYKGLINAIKWLGYDDVYVREWFKNVKENKKLSLIVPYDAKDRSKTILMFSADERKALKKLNQLSLNYCITRETGTIDDWGTPNTENCYSYTIEEVFAKLVSLKKWLEKNIIGVNARIIDITGEGVYFERYINLTYVTDNRGFTYRGEQSLTPYTLDSGYSELIQGEASIYMSLKEFDLTSIQDMPYRISDYTSIIWDPDTSTYVTPGDKVWDTGSQSYILTPESSAYLANPDKYLHIGAPPSNPFVGINDIQWKASVSKPYSGVITDTFVTNPLWVYNNTLRFYNIFDSSTIFYDLHNYPSPDTSVALDIILEKAYIRDASNDNWEESLQYSIYPDPDPSAQGGFILESSLGSVYKFGDYVNFSPNGNGLLQFADNEIYRTPLLSFKNFVTNDIDDNIITLGVDKLYNLDILDGKISMNISPPNYQDIIYYINYFWDYLTNEQSIRLNVEYISPRMPIYQADPSTYYWADPSGMTGGGESLFIDNSTYQMKVNHIGDYNVEVNVWDGYNTLYTNAVKDQHKVFIKNPEIRTIIRDKCITSSFCSKIEIPADEVNTLIEDNQYPIFDRYIAETELTLRKDSSGTSYISAPAISFFQDLPVSGDIMRIQNTTEQATLLNGNNLTVNKRFQDFFEDDDVILMNTYKGNYNVLREASTYITGVSGEILTLNNIPTDFILDISHNIFIINDTMRAVYNINNNDSSAILIADVSNYSFLENQLVDLVIYDSCVGQYLGSSYRVTDVSGNNHTFNNALPQFVVDNSTRYDIYAKHSYSTFAMFEMDVSTSLEIDGSLNLYTENDHRQYGLDSTFYMFKIPYSHEYAENLWYNVSDGLITDVSVFYYYDQPISINPDALVLFQSYYDASNYLINSKNIWTFGPSQSPDVTVRAYNNTVPFTFDTTGYYDILLETYDMYGNLSYNLSEGYIKV